MITQNEDGLPADLNEVPDDTAEVEDYDELSGDPAAKAAAEETGLDPAKQQLGVRGEDESEETQ